MRYQPVTLKDRSFVGRNWNRYFLRSIQVILQASHGVVSGNPSFFDHAFGESYEKFESLLWLPHEFIFYRDYYFIWAGSPILEEYNSLFQKLTSGEKEELLCALVGDANQKGLKPSKYKYLINDRSLSNPVRRILGFYAAYGSASGTVPSSIHLHRDLYVPEEKKVEDAGLYDDPDDDIRTKVSEFLADYNQPSLPL